MNLQILIPASLIICFLLIPGGIAGQMSTSPSGASLSFEQSYSNIPLNETNSTAGGMQYVDALPGEQNVTNRTDPYAGSYTSGTASTEFSGTSISGNGANQSPSAVNTFSDKTLASGYIKNFLKSFHWESGTDL